MKENKPFIFNKTDNITHLSEACLNQKADNSKVYVKIAVDDCEYNLCVLQKNHVESYNLDHFIGWSKQNISYKLLISGGGPNAEVHFTGYIEMEDTEDNEDYVPGENVEISNKNKDKENSKNDLELNEDAFKEKKLGNAVKNEKKGNKMINAYKNPSESGKNKEDNKNKNENKDSNNGLIKLNEDEEIEKLLNKKRNKNGSEDQTNAYKNIDDKHNKNDLNKNKKDNKDLTKIDNSNKKNKLNRNK